MNKMILTLMLGAAAGFFLQACSSFPKQKEMLSMARVYDRPYDTVYSSVQELLRRDLRFVLKTDDKSGGRLETEWAHRMDTEGKKRWMVRTDLRKVKSGTEVIFYKKSDLQDDVSKSLDKYNNKKKKDTVETPTGGWKKIDVDLASVNELYRILERKLEPQE